MPRVAPLGEDSKVFGTGGAGASLLLARARVPPRVFLFSSTAALRYFNACGANPAWGVGELES